MGNRSLEDLRREIDEIDDAIHDLIMRRSEVVQHVSSAKKGAKLPIRPSREASMLRRLDARHSGTFPLSALARIWHEMIAAFTMIQANYTVAVFADDAHHSLWDLARDQFGSQVPMSSHETRQEVIQSLHSGDADVAVLPPPEDDPDAPWWTSIATPNSPVIVQHLPFAGVGNVRGTAAEGVAVAFLELEPTGDDITMIVILSDEQLSRSRLVSGLAKHNLNVSIVATSDGHGEWLYLARVDEFVAKDDPRLKACADEDHIHRAQVIGAYARPITADTMTRRSRLSAPPASDADRDGEKGAA